MSTASIVADGLTDEGFDVRDPMAGNSHFLKVVNARRAYCEIIISEKGAVSWEYRCFDGGTGPAQIASMVLAILGAGVAESDHASLELQPGPTLKGSVGRALRERGMLVGTSVVGLDESCELYAEICITNPEMPNRGTVHVNDEGMIIWECRVNGPTAGDDQGIAPAELTRTIAAALQVGQRTGDPTP